MASARLDDFKEDIARAKDLIGLGQAIGAILTEPDAALRELGARSSVAQRLVKETFQQPDDVAAALALVGGKSRLQFRFYERGFRKSIDRCQHRPSEQDHPSV